MLVMTLESVPQRLKGRIRRWLIEIQPGVFVGKVSPKVRDLLWEEATKSLGAGRVSQAWAQRNEQGYAFRIDGDVQRKVVDVDGLQLLSILK